MAGLTWPNKTNNTEHINKKSKTHKMDAQKQEWPVEEVGKEMILYLLK